MKPSRHPINARGSVLVVAMMMTLLGGLFIAGWMGLASMRAAYASNSENAARRRLLLENSKAYAAQIARQNAMSGASSLAGFPSTLTDGSTPWGGIDTNGGWADLGLYDLPPGTTYPITGDYNRVHPYNCQGLHPGPSFLSEQVFRRPAAFAAPAEAVVEASPSARLAPTMNDFNAYVFLKAVCPCLAGDGLVTYRKPDAEPGQLELATNLLVNGRIVVRDPASFFSSTTANLGGSFRINAQCLSLYVQKVDPNNRITGTSTNNLQIAPSNMPAVPSTYGPYPTSGSLNNSDLYAGNLNIIQNTTNTANSLWDIQQREATAGHSALQTINSGTATGVSTDPWYIVDETNPPYPPPQWPSGYPYLWKTLYINLDNPRLTNLRIYGVVQQIVFLGQSTSTAYNNAATLSPLSIIVVPGATGLTVNYFAFVRENNRPFILGAKGAHKEALNMFWEPLTIPGVATPLTVDWKLIFINEYRQVTLLPPNQGGVNSVALWGGILTNWSVKRLITDTGLPATFTINPQWLVDGDAGSFALASVLPRDAWVESFFQLASP